MSEHVRIQAPIKFGGDFELDPRAFELRRSGKPLKLERIPMELLVLLVERRGELVTRDKIIERIWGKDVFLDTDNSINAAVRKIRQVLKDDPDRPRFVFTVTGRGYRFVAPVEDISPPEPIPPAPPEPKPGDYLLGKRISHYRLIQLLGGGGMGVVYKAEDLKLCRPVALKLLAGEMVGDPVAFERLQREARAASALDHPNICSIYQLGEHEGQPFIVMQLLQGQTLREWIESAANKKIADRVRELIDLGIQIADGLTAAHQKGIIHRDIKPTNLFVTDGGRAKILDFGVATFVDAADLGEAKTPASSLIGNGAAVPANLHLTRTGASIGTPSYLSPEQIRREKLDARTDLYSFGLVLYEMATGQRAFASNTATAIRDAILQLAPVPVRQLNPAVPVELDAIITRALEKERALRYQSATEIRNDLDNLRDSLDYSATLTTAPGAAISRTAASLPSKFSRIYLPLVALVIGGLLGYGILIRHKDHLETATSSSPPARRSVAVLGFDNLSRQPSSDWLSTGLSEMLGTELAAGGKIRLIPGDDVARAKKDMQISENGTLSKFNLARLRKNLGVDLVVFGSYTVLGNGQTRLDLRLENAATGENVAVLAETGDEKRLFDLVSLTGAELRQRLGVGMVPAAYQAGVQASLPANPEAARLYSQGLDRLEVFDSLEARDLLLKASQIDPKHAATHSALGEAWRNLGYDARAQEEAQKAVDLSANLATEDRLWFQGLLHEARHEWDKAAVAYRKLFETFPDGLDYGLRLASVEISAAKSRDALSTLDLLRKLPFPARDDPRIDVMATTAYAQLGDYKRGQEVAARALQTARLDEATLVAARALGAQCEALRNMGEFTQAIAACEEAQQSFMDSGDRRSVAAMINSIALTLADQGDFSRAKARFQEALAIAQKIGDNRGEARYSNNLALTLSSQSDFNGALGMFGQSLKIAREIGDRGGAINTLGNIGLNLEFVGDLAGARPKFDEAIALARETGNKQSEASNWIHSAELRLIEGDLPGTTHGLETADALLEGTGDKRHHLYALYCWGEVLRARDELAGAHKKIEEALETSKQIGAKDLVAYSQMSLANLIIDEGNSSQAIPLAQAAVDEYQAEKSPDFQLQALKSLADARLKNGQAAEAFDAMQRAQALLSKLKDPMMQIDVTTGLARTSAAIGKAKQTLAQLRSAIVKAHRMGAVGYEFEARLALGEIEMRHGSQKSGRACLQQLQTDARNKGFLLIARKAENVLRGQSRS